MRKMLPSAVALLFVPVFVHAQAPHVPRGTATDVTDRVHPEVAARAIDAARAVGLDIAGVDVVALTDFFANTAWNPRSILAPWSASPIAASSWVR